MSERTSATTSSTWEASSSFARFYSDVFRPNAHWYVSGYKLRLYDQVVNRLVAHCGGTSPSLGQVTSDLVDEMLAAQLDNRSENWRQQVAGVIHKIMRAWNPLACLRHVAPPVAPGTLRAHFENYYLPERMTGAAVQTVCEYRIALKVLNAHVGRDVALGELSDLLLSDFLKTLLDAGRSVRTVNNYRARLLAIWRHAWSHGFAAHEPRLAKLKEPRDVPDAWTHAELQRIFAAAKQFEPDNCYGPVPKNDWFVAALFVAYETALRRRSLLAIGPGDVNLKDGTLYVCGRNMKDRDGQEYQLSRGAIEAIARIHNPRRPYLFRCDTLVTLPAFAHRIERDFRKIIALAGVDLGNRRGLTLWHKVRRTTATQLAIVAGVAAACQLLGHSTEYCTERYIDPTQLPRRDVTAVLPTLDSAAPAAAAG